MFENSKAWSIRIFSRIAIKDKRITKRLQKTGEFMADNAGSTIPCATSSKAKVEGAYRIIRNDKVTADDIANSGFLASAELADKYGVLLALEDTTTLSFNHKTVYDEMGPTGTKRMVHAKGILVHSVLLHDPVNRIPVGLIYQNRWRRPDHVIEKNDDVKDKLNDENSSNKEGSTQDEKPNKKTKAAKKDANLKESYKWQKASEESSKRLGNNMSKIISVCDREADFIDYIHFKYMNNERFVVRSSHDRNISVDGDIANLHKFTDQLTSAGKRIVPITQRGGRKARKATCMIYFSKVAIKAPPNSQCKTVTLNYVRCIEKLSKAQIDKGETEGLCWHLLTTETISNASDANRIIGYYEQRWVIESFHNAWKSGGTKVEELRMKSLKNLSKAIVIKSFIAIRLLQIQLMSVSENIKRLPADKMFSNRELVFLKKQYGLGKFKEHTIQWACQAIGKLAGWKDSKRTGIVGWKLLWEGWSKLKEILIYI